MVVPVRPEVQEKYVSFVQFGKIIRALTFVWWQFSWQWNIRYLLTYHNDEKTLMTGNKTGSKKLPG